MPELPEVETIRRDLESLLVGRVFAQPEVRLPKIVKSNQGEFAELLTNAEITGIDRVGKLLLFRLKDRPVSLHIHLKMTGQLIYRTDDRFVAGGHPWPALTTELPHKYTHLIFPFTDGTKLYFNDLRQFGFARLAPATEEEQVRQKFGLEPHDPEFTFDHFRSLLRGRKTILKAFLLNQQLIAGLGNIYADEVCFAAHVRPDRPTASLTETEQDRLFQACRDILAEAITHRGTTLHDYVDGNGEPGGYAKLLKVYGREGQHCLRCKNGVIAKIRLAGRGTHFCPNCQS